MKKLLLISFCFLLYYNSFAQLYKSCLSGEIIRWSFLDQRDCVDGFAYVKSTEIVAYGDISINDVMYKKLYLDESFDSLNDAEESNVNWKNHAPQLYYEWENFFIRESDDASKLYIYNSDWDEEYLISNMDLEKGSIFQFYDPYYEETFDATVDSIYIENGLKHIRFPIGDENLSCSKDGCHFEQLYFTFIESVGSDMWLIYPDGCVLGTLGLNCFQNQAMFYKNNKIMNYHLNFADFHCGCYYSSAGVNTVPEDNYHIFIQQDKIEILFPSNINTVISVCDMNGVLYYEHSFHAQNVEIPIAKFATGVYILRIFDKNMNKLYTSKVIL